MFVDAQRERKGSVFEVRVVTSLMIKTKVPDFVVEVKLPMYFALLAMKELCFEIAVTMSRNAGQMLV